jgi:RNA polymerase sigma-32 factor
MESRRKTLELGAYSRDIGRHRVLSREEEIALARRFRAGDKDAGQALVTANLRLVVKIAGSYRSYGAGFADLVQEGNLGLIAAVKKFDPERGVRLISYAVYWIKATIRAYLLRSWSIVKMGGTLEERQLFFALRKHEQQSADESLEPLSHQLGVELSRVQTMKSRLTLRDRSLDGPTTSGSPTAAVDRVVSDAAPPDELLGDAEEAQIRRRTVQAALANLDRRERFIVRSHLMVDDPKPLRVLAGRLGISRERVRQLEQRACTKMIEALSACERSEAA